MVKSKKVADSLTRGPVPPHRDFVVWLGMKTGDTLDSWSWQYGTRGEVDFSFFDVKDGPDKGNGGEPENCVAVNNKMKAYDSLCNSQVSYICEKDLPPVSALGPKPDSVASLRVMPFVPIASALTGMLAIH